MFTELLTVVTIITSIFWYYSEKQRLSKGKRLPGPGLLSLICDVVQILLHPCRRNYEIMEDLCSKYGPIVGVRLGREFVIVQDFELTKKIMAAEDWSNRAPPAKFVMERSFNKNLGLIWSHGESWKEMRKYSTRIMRQFGFGKGASMESFIEQEALEFIKNLDTIRQENNDVVYIKQMFNIPALNLLWTMMAGIRFPYDNETFATFLDSAHKMTLAIRPGITPLTGGFEFLRFIPGLTEHDDILKIHYTVQKLFKDIIDKRRAKGTYLDNPDDFLDVFLRDIDTVKSTDPKAEYYTEEQMIMVCLDLFFTSSDTTSAALGFAILYMIHHPEIMAKVQQEIDSVVGPTRIPNLDDKLIMPYVEATTLEVLRYASINPVAARSPKKDSFINGYFIPKNSMIALLLHSIHFSEPTWGDPLNFRPERFLDKDMNIINADKIIPFGYGKRICMGENLAKASFFTFFTMLMQKYSFEKSPSHPEPTLAPRTGLTNTPEPFYVVIKSRSK